MRAVVVPQFISLLCDSYVQLVCFIHPNPTCLRTSFPR